MTAARGARSPGRGRRRARAAVLLLLAAVAALLAGPGPPTGPGAGSLAVGASTGPAEAGGTHWTAFHGSENHSGYTQIDGPTTGPPTWDLAPPTPQPVPIRAGVVANDTMVYFVNDFGTVWAYNRSAAPSLQWHRDLGTTPTTPDLWNGELIVGGSNGELTALNASDGAIDWVASLDGVLTQGVAVAGGSVFVATTNGSVWAVNASTGIPEWRALLGGPSAGAIAVEGTTLVAVTTGGAVEAFGTDGHPIWNRSVGHALASGPAIFAGDVVVADTWANVTELALSNGSVAWTFVGRALSVADVVESTPAVDPERVYVETYLGQVVALDRSNGSVVWHRSTGFTGYPVLSSPAIAPNGLYLSDAYQYVDDLDPATGVYVWHQSLGYSPAYGPPAVDGGVVFEGVDTGTVLGFGPLGGPPKWPVTGVVVDPSGRPVDSATVLIGAGQATTGPDGSFAVNLTNGTYRVTISASGYYPNETGVTVAGPLPGLRFVLVPVPYAPVSGRVLDGQTLRPLAGVPVFFFGPYGSAAQTVTDANGSYRLLAPVGADYVTASPPPGYRAYAAHLTVPADGLSGVDLSLPSTAGILDGRLALVPVGVAALAVLVVGVQEAQRRRRAMGLSGKLLSPFANYVAMRVVLLGFQALAILSVLYVFGTMLPAAAFHVGPCAFIDEGCGPGGWSNPSNAFLAFGFGIWHFVGRLVTGDWGMTSFGPLHEPAVLFLQWYGPNSIELALFALPIAAALAWGIGLWAGAHPDSTFDVVARVGSIAGLLIPSFLIVLLFLGAVYDPFSQRLGDAPYGLIPTPVWFVQHGGYPDWIGIGGNTLPTGFPLVDGAIHGAWDFERLVLVKTLWQALAIAIVYVAIYLRFIRYAVGEAFRETSVVAARARGVPERTILWRHTGRRILPMLVLVFGLTLPLYLGTQALVEALAQDNGVGTLLIAQMSRTLQSGFGFRTIAPGQTPESFYQVTIFLLVLLVLGGELVADVVARYLDPRLLRAPR